LRTELALASSAFVAARAELCAIPSLPVVWRVWLRTQLG